MDAQPTDAAQVGCASMLHPPYYLFTMKREEKRMSNAPRDRAAAARQVQQRLESLQAAGVEFLPAPDRSLPPPMPDIPEGGMSLFAEAPSPTTDVDPEARRK